jgi:hypothetical protein
MECFGPSEANLSFNQETLRDLKAQSDNLKDEIFAYRRNLAEMKEASGLVHLQATEEVRGKLAELWELAQKEMNDDKNEHFFLTREIQKLLNKKETLIRETGEAIKKMTRLEGIVGLKNSRAQN